MSSDSVERLQRLMIDGGQRAFDLVPLALSHVINERQWAEKRDRDGQLFTSFEAFVAHKLWHGLESSIDDLLAYCRKRPDVQALIRREVGAAAEHGGARRGALVQGDNITLNEQRGTNPTYTLRRLKRDRPDLAEKVVGGEMSANAAAIEAGFRKKLTAYEQVLRLLPKLSARERSELLRMLEEDGAEKLLTSLNAISAGVAN